MTIYEKETRHGTERVAKIADLRIIQYASGSLGFIDMKAQEEFCLLPDEVDFLKKLLSENEA